MISLHDRGMACHGMAAATGGVASCHVSQSSCLRRVHGASACLSTGVGAERASRTIYPPAQQTFSAFNLSPLPDIKVVILGQDPYHGPGAVARGGGDGDAKLLLLR
jgi:hypothetical protein